MTYAWTRHFLVGTLVLGFATFGRADVAPFADLVSKAYELHVKDPMRAINYGEQALQLLPASADPEQVRKLYAALTWAYVEAGRFEHALGYAEQMRQMAVDRNEPQNLIRALRAIAQIHFDAGRVGDAVEAFTDAQRIAEQQDGFQLGGILIGLGQAFESRGDYQRALQRYHAASLYFSERGSALGEAVALANVASIHGALGRYDQAIQYAEQSVAILTELNDRRRVALVYLDVGKWHRLAGRPQQALALHETYLQEIDSLALHLEAARFLGEIGEDHLAMGSTEQALRAFEQAARVWQAESHPKELAETQLRLVSIMLARGANAQALQHLESTMATIWLVETEFQRDRLQEIALLHLANVNQALGRTGEAFMALERHNNLLQARLQREKEQSLADAAARFELDLKDKEIQLLQERQTHQQAELVWQRELRFGLLALLVLGGAVIVLLVNQVRLRSRALADREFADQERSARLAQLKILSGLLPICSVCKKIRDDDGDWRQLESYIDTYSEASFTHSICESCMEAELAQVDPGMQPDPST